MEWQLPLRHLQNAWNDATNQVLSIPVRCGTAKEAFVKVLTGLVLNCQSSSFQHLTACTANAHLGTTENEYSRLGAALLCSSHKRARIRHVSGKLSQIMGKPVGSLNVVQRKEDDLPQPAAALE